MPGLPLRAGENYDTIPEIQPFLVACRPSIICRGKRKMSCPTLLYVKLGSPIVIVAATAIGLAASYKLDFGQINSGGEVQQSAHYSAVSSGVTHGAATRAATSSHYSIEPASQSADPAAAGVQHWYSY